MSWLRVKICCISSQREAEVALSAGADALGLVSNMPSGPGVIEESVIAQISRNVPSSTETFLLTSETEPEAIANQFIRTGVNTLQLVDWVGPEKLSEIRFRCGGVRIVQVLHVESERQIEEAQEIERFVDAILLDSGRPGAPVKELGGTGRTHNWDISNTICDAVSVPVYLAGGLNSENISEAVRKVNPFGVDLCSGVRTNGHLDAHKLEQFFANVASFRVTRPPK